MTHLPNTEQRLFARFLYFSGIELILAGAWMFTIAISQNLQTTTLLAASVMIVGVVCFAAPTLLKKQAANIVSALGSGFGQLGALALPLIITAFLFLRNPGMDALTIIGAPLVCVWLIGIEALFFFYTPKESKPEHASSSRLAFIVIPLAYGILLVPSRVPSILDGFPWNTPLEFVAATLILPFGFFLGRKFLSQKGVTLLLALLLAVKITLGFFLPQAGLGVRVYFSEEALNTGRHERTYESYLDPDYSQVAQLPYRSFHEFPVESINRHGFDKESFRMTMQFDGVIALNVDERLVVIVQGTTERRIELTDMATGEVYDVRTVKSADELNAELFNEIPYVGTAGLSGTLLFANYGNGRFEPTILRSDGSASPAYSNIWLSAAAIDFPRGFFQLIQNLIALLLPGIFLFAAFDGFFTLYRTGLLDIVDAYLALTGLVLYYLADTADKPGIHSLFIPIFIALTAAMWLGFILRSRTYSPAAYLLAVGLPVLLMFLPLDIRNLQGVVVLPQYQDVTEYQMLARNIYVAGDVFLLQSPPWAYKVLYPYIAGFLHILFGQSLSGQFYLNLWSAVLTVILTVEIAAYFGLSKRAAFIAASLFFLSTLLPASFIYFYRFGLIEPLAIAALLLGAYFAKEGNFGAMFAVGVLTGMLRLNFAGAIFTSITLLATACVGGFSQAWGSFVNWLRLSWRRWVPYLAAIPFPSLLIAYIYSRFHPGYTLTHEMNDQTSFGSVLTSLAMVIVGGDEEFLVNQIQGNPLDLALISLPILFGLLAALASLFYRKGVFAKIDLRLSLFLLSMLPVYAILKPIGYFPRYSWAFLPPALILLGLVLQFAFLRDNKALQGTQ